MSDSVVDLSLGRRRARRAPAAETRTVPLTTRLQITVAVDAAQRLRVHEAMDGESAGEIVTRLIRAHLKNWQLPRRGHDDSRDVSEAPAA